MRRSCETQQRGQANVEFVIAIPVLLMLIGGIFLAGFYTWRAVTANWGVYVSGVAGGAYDPAAINQVQSSIYWADIRQGMVVTERGQTVNSELSFDRPFSFLGMRVSETQEGRATFHLWRFVAGPAGSTP